MLGDLSIIPTRARKWWVWPSWLGRQIVALEVVGSSPITHPSALLHKSEASNAEVSSLLSTFT